MSTEDGGQLAIYIDGVEYDGDWSSVLINGVISVEIQFTSPEIPEEEKVGTKETPGFGIFTSLAAILVASIFIGSRRDS